MSKTIHECLDSIDYEKIHALMMLMGWTWSGPYGEKGKVPEVKDLKDCATNLMYTLQHSELDNNTCGTGGFTATKFTFDGRVSYTLHFGFKSH